MIGLQQKTKYNPDKRLLISTPPPAKRVSRSTELDERIHLVPSKGLLPVPYLRTQNFVEYSSGPSGACSNRRPPRIAGNIFKLESFLGKKTHD